MRKKNQRKRAGLGRRIAYRHLGAWRAAWGIGEGVLGCRRKILTRMLASRRIPNLAREHAIPRSIPRFDGTHSNRKLAAREWIVRRRPAGMQAGALDNFAGHGECPLGVAFIFAQNR